MERIIYNEEHEMFRTEFRKFLDREVVPFYDEFEKQGMVPRKVWLKAGKAGFLCPWAEEKYGGSGVDFLYSAVMIEVIAERNLLGFYINLHNDTVMPYIDAYANEEQKSRWIPKCCTGEYIAAVAMTEPDTGSDLQAMRTRAIRDGDHYIVNGEKAFISNGLLNDICVVAVVTDPKAQPAYKGITLLVVENGTPGYVRGPKLEKIGLHAQDTAGLSFIDCRVPVENRLGEEGEGFKMMMRKLQQERIVVSTWCTTFMWTILEETRKYITERKAFGKTIASFQNTRFKMAEMYTIAEMTQVFMDRLIADHSAGKNVDTQTAMVKYWAGENMNKVADQCLQFFGGYGYMEEYPIARMYRDARVHTIFAGTSEIMKEIVARNFLGR